MFDTTSERAGGGANGGGDVDKVVPETIRNEFNITMCRAVVDLECEALEFQCDAVEVFFKVFVQLGEDGVEVLVDIFSGSSVGKSDVCT